MVLKAFHRWLLGALLLAALFHAPQASANPDLLQSEARVASAVLEWDAARGRLAETTREQRRLAERIAIEKNRGGGRELERLLRASLDSERAVASQSREVQELSNVVRRAIDEAFRKAALAFRAAKPQLRAKDTAARQEAQETVAIIQRLRARLKEHQLALAERNDLTPKDWEKYDQKPAKDDGPEDLRAKADFVADHRDKFKKKRQELLKLIEEARQERELSRIAANFQQDAFLYDENARSSRVARGTAELSTLNNNDSRSVGEPAPAVQNSGNEATNPPPGNDSPSPPLSPSADPGAAFGGNAEGRSTDTPSQNDGASGSTPTPVQNPPAAAASPSLGATVPLPREFNPTALLNLEIDRIDAASVSLEQLISTLRNLEKLDELLARRETELTTKATQLEQAEKSGVK